MMVAVFFHSSPSLGHNTLGRIERDSQNWTRRRSRSDHCAETSSPRVGPIPPPASKMLRRQGTKIVIRCKFRYSGVMVLSALVIQSTPRESARKATSLSFVAFEFERSIEPELDSAGKGGEPSVQSQIPNRRTNEHISNIEIFESVRTPIHQRHCQRNILLAMPHQHEPPEVDAIR